MPTYEYQCPRCDAIYEQVHRIGRAPDCIDCADEDCGDAARLIISSAAFQLKGVGWAKDGYYRTDREMKKI